MPTQINVRLSFLPKVPCPEAKRDLSNTQSDLREADTKRDLSDTKRDLREDSGSADPQTWSKSVSAEFVGRRTSCPQEFVGAMQPVSRVSVTVDEALSRLTAVTAEKSTHSTRAHIIQEDTFCHSLTAELTADLTDEQSTHAAVTDKDTARPSVRWRDTGYVYIYILVKVICIVTLCIKCTRALTFENTYVYTYIYTYSIHIYTHIYTYACVCVCVFVCVCVCVCARARAYIYIYIHVYIYIYIYI